MACDYRSRIVLTLLIAACAPIASLPVLAQPISQSRTTAPLLETAITPVNQQITSCNRTYPALCIYANRGWVSHLEQGLWATDDPIASQQDLEPDTALTSHRRTTDATHLSRKIRLLTRLKTWLDAVSE